MEARTLQKALCSFLIVTLLIAAFPAGYQAAVRTKTLQKTATKMALTVGDQYKLQIKNTTVKWSRKNVSVLSLSKTGVIKAKKAGSAVIRYTAGKKTKSVKVTVRKKASGQSAAVSYVWLAATGSKYHKINHCGRMNPQKAARVTLSYARSHGFDACSKCF